MEKDQSDQPAEIVDEAERGSAEAADTGENTQAEADLTKLLEDARSKADAHAGGAG